MRILYLKMVKFKRFPLSCVELFEHEFKSKLLMVSGPNGSGKSSLFNEMSPLPSDKNDFYPGGYKEIRLEHDGRLYTLISDFREGAKFFFLLDGEELNTANIVTTQKELVNQHFKITSVIHDIMVGKENFTSMSLPARKKLFSAITHLNIDKVLDGYNKLKEQQKTNTLLLKTLLVSYQAEEQKLIDKDRLASLNESFKVVKANTDNLLNMRGELQRYAPYSTEEEAYKDLTGLSVMIKAMVSANTTLLTAYPNKDLDSLTLTNTSNLTLVTHQLNTVYGDLDKRQRELKVLEHNGSANRQSLLDEKARLLRHTQILTNSFKIFKDPSIITDQTHMAVYKLETTLPEILRELQTNIGLDGEKLYTTERYNYSVEEKRKLVERLQNLNAMELAIKHNLITAKDSTGNVACPKCSHSWPVREALTASLHGKNEIEAIQVEQIEVRSSMARVERTIDELTEYFTLYRQYLNLRKETLDILRPFWENIAEKDLVFTDPTGILSVINMVNLELSYNNDLTEAYKEIAAIDRKLESIVASENVNIDSVKAAISLLDTKAIELQEEKMRLTEEARCIVNAKTVYDNLSTLEESLKKAKKKVTEANMSNLVSNVTDVVDDEIRNLKITLISIEKEIQQSSSVQYSLDSYQLQIDDTKENLKVLDLAIEELCPKNGLIAKSVSSFLNTIIGNINSVISRIWEYKMILKPINVESDSLNYKFKVEVEDKLTINDIASCSSGMQEIINLSFKMTLYKLLGLEHYPIFLDEFGSKLDILHRTKVFSIIFSMINDPYYSQIFMVTHIDTSIANYKDVEVLEI